MGSTSIEGWLSRWFLYIVTRMPANNAIGNTSLILPLVLTMICCRLPSDNTQCLPVLDPDFLSLN